MHKCDYVGINMCTRFVYNGDDTVVGFNFDIDCSVWTHAVIVQEDRFFIGIKMPDNMCHSFHGINNIKILKNIGLTVIRNHFRRKYYVQEYSFGPTLFVLY